jgi:hypothetical protein
MDRAYDIFEKFPNGDVAWCCSVHGREHTIAELNKLAAKSPNEFFAIYIPTNDHRADQRCPGLRIMVLRIALAVAVGATVCARFRSRNVSVLCSLPCPTAFFFFFCLAPKKCLFAFVAAPLSDRCNATGANQSADDLPHTMASNELPRVRAELQYLLVVPQPAVRQQNGRR